MLRVFVLILALAVPGFAQQPSVIKGKFFPYEIHYRTLKNGLPVVVIATPEFKDMVTFATPVYAGSRNETERGKTGLAHLFEHIMFRHEFGGKPGGYDEQIRRMGAHNNAWTNRDMTFYYPTTFTSNLVGPIQRPDGPVAGLITLEAGRFQDLKVDRKTFEVEAGAVLGEYRRIFSNPILKMLEETAQAAFPDHPYGHTVIGYLDDVEKMPQAWDAAWDFFRHYYTPNNVALVVVGDVRPAEIFTQAEKHYAGWKPAPAPRIPGPSPLKGPRQVHVDWEADVAPHMMVAQRTPAMDPRTAEGAVTFILEELLVSRSAPLFQKLRYQKQTATDLYVVDTPVSTDPYMLMLDAEMSLERFQKEGEKYVADVRSDMVQGLEDLKSFSRQPGAAQTLEVIKSKMRNDFLAQLSSTGAIAGQFSRWFRFTRDPSVLDLLMQSINDLKPADIDAYAQKYFTPERRVLTTLWAKPGQKEAQ